MSMIKSVNSVEPTSKFHLFYGNKNADNTIFKSDIDGISSNINVSYIYSRDSNAEQPYNGRLDSDKVNTLLRANLEYLKGMHFSYVVLKK